MHKPAPKTLILDLLSSQRSDARLLGMPVAALVAAAELFGIEGNALRVALTRLCGAGLVVRDDSGLYSLGERALAVSRRVDSWRGLSDLLRPWKGSWLGVLLPGRARPSRDDDRALRLLGIRELSHGLWLRPDNLRGGVDAARAQLHELGLSPDAVVCGVSELDAERERAARELWDGAELERGYRTSRTTLRASAAKMAQMPQRERMVETFVVGGSVLRQMALDPLLPEPLVATPQRRALLDELRVYDALGRKYWTEFLAEYGVRQVRGPVDLHRAFEPELRALSQEGSP